MHIHTCFEFNHNHPDLHRHILGSLATKDILSGRIDKTLSLVHRKYSQEYVFKRLGNSWINQPLSYMLECSRLYVHAYMKFGCECAGMHEYLCSQLASIRSQESHESASHYNGPSAYIHGFSF